MGGGTMALLFLSYLHIYSDRWSTIHWAKATHSVLPSACCNAGIEGQSFLFRSSSLGPQVFTAKCAIKAAYKRALLKRGSWGPFIG